MRGFTFVDNTTGTAANLNALVDSAIILPGAITEQASLAPVAADQFMFYSSSLASLKKCTLTQLIAAFPGDATAGTKSLRSLGTGATQAAAGNDTRFPASITGPRVGHGAGADTVANANDLAFGAQNLLGGLNIAWDAAEVFYDTLSGASNKTYIFSNLPIKARVITVVLLKGSWTGTVINWPTLIGASPLVDTSATANVYTFIKTAIGIVGVVKSV